MEAERSIEHGTANQTPHEKRTDVVRARVTAAEKAHVEAQAERAGLDPTEFIRRRVLGYEVPAAQGIADARLLTELNRIGVNLNQVARMVNAGATLLHVVDDILTELRGVLAQVAAAS